MKILHICPHMGGGVGAVIMGWMEKVGGRRSGHQILCLDYANEKAKKASSDIGFSLGYNGINKNGIGLVNQIIADSDIMLCHYWNHPMMAEFLSKPLPDCRLVFWHHQNLPVPQEIKDYPDLFIGTSPIQGYDRHIWSTGGVSRFLEVKPVAHRGFTIAYVGWVDYRKLHKDLIPMCHEIKKRIPEAKFIIAGEIKIPIEGLEPEFQFLGHTDDVAGVLAQCDVFGYPLRPDHFGTCEQVLGEAMEAGVVPVVMDNPAERLILREDYFLANAEDYSEYIEYLHDNPDDRIEMAGMVRGRAARLYSIDKMVKAWDEVFQELMEKPKRSHNVL